ncbi:MAG: NodT family efflux system outer rane lipoprotein, partial [Nevskia sp.]|nr:NodT family efflux system outer rane lipoprotein [Nevskia sp.]
MYRLMPFAAAAVLGACAVGPDYIKPEGAGGAAVAPSFANVAEPGFASGDIELHFWERFNDPMLNQLVAAALSNNNDLRIAVANLNAARAAYRLSTYDLAPTVTADADYQRALESRNQLPGATHDQRSITNVDAGFDAFWELDFFGRVRREVEEARAGEQSAEASLRDAQVSVTAEVARDYFGLRGLQDQLAVAIRNADNQEKSLQLTQVRLEAGRGNELDTSRAEAQLRTTQARIPPLEAGVANMIYALSVLIGRQPDALTAQLAPVQALPELPALSNIGTPETLLRRRPDVQVAERNLAAATAGIGVAVGDLFPKVTVAGAIGYNAGSFGGVGNTGSGTYAYGPSISWAAFDLGRVQARIRAARANADAQMAAYQKSVLLALQETEGALITYSRSAARMHTLEQATLASDKAAHLARQRFEAGLTDFLNVLDAEREALDAETSLAQSR